ncbi:unnamed protein product [Amoebophrya sp. A120]|nr:unnamed protein product [Amoebophrya sp. A120]|eukprot:GSA120T00003783001.1
MMLSSRKNTRECCTSCDVPLYSRFREKSFISHRFSSSLLLVSTEVEQRWTDWRAAARRALLFLVAIMLLMSSVANPGSLFANGQIFPTQRSTGPGNGLVSAPDLLGTNDLQCQSLKYPKLLDYIALISPGEQKGGDAEARSAALGTGVGSTTTGSVELSQLLQDSTATQPWTKSTCVQEAATLHFLHNVLQQQSHQNSPAASLDATSSTTEVDPVHQALSAVPEDVFSVFNVVQPNSKLAMLIASISCLFPTNQILALSNHPLDKIRNHSADFFLFRDWVANHLYHAILPPLADSVHYLARERQRFAFKNKNVQAEVEPTTDVTNIKPVNAASLFDDGMLVTNSSQPLLENFCPFLSKAMGYLVVALSMQEILPLPETLAVVQAAENAVGKCVAESSSLVELVYERTDPLLWVLLTTVYLRLGKVQPHSCMHWSKGVGGEDVRKEHMRAVEPNHSTIAGTSAATATPQSQFAQSPPTPASSLAQAAAAAGVGMTTTTQLGATSPAPPIVAASTNSRPVAPPAAHPFQLPNAQQWEPYGIFELSVGLRENCFTKQGNDIWAGYEDNLRRCLGNRRILQFFVFDVAANKLRPAVKTSGGFVHEPTFSSGNSALEISWHRTNEFGRDRLLVKDARWLSREHLYVSLALPDVLPALIIEPTSATDVWNKEWLESYAVAMEQLGFEPQTVQSPEEARQLMLTVQHSASGGRSLANAKKLVLFWRINQMFQGTAASTGAASSTSSAHAPALANGPALSEELVKYTSNFAQPVAGVVSNVFVYPKPETAALYQNKLTMLEAFIREDIPVPPFRLVTGSDVVTADMPLPPFPVLLKHAYAASSRGLAQCDTLSQFPSCLQSWFQHHPDQEVVIVMQKLEFVREMRLTFLAGEIVHGYWRIKEKASDLAASTHISNSTLSFDDLPLREMKPIVQKISAQIMDVGALDAVIVDGQVFVFEVSPIFDMNPEPETAALKQIPYTAYKKTESYTKRRLEGYVAFCKQFVNFAVQAVEFSSLAATLFVDIDNTLNYAYRRFQMYNVPDPFDPELVLQDEVIGGAEQALQAIAASNRYRIVYLTARVFRNAIPATHNWLFTKHQFPVAPVVFTATANEKISYLAEGVNFASEEQIAAEFVRIEKELLSSQKMSRTSTSLPSLTSNSDAVGHSQRSCEIKTDDLLLATSSTAAVAKSGSTTSASSSSSRLSTILQTTNGRCMRRNKKTNTGVNILIDDLTRAHHQQRFEEQEVLLALLDRHAVPFIQFNTLYGPEHWAQIAKALVA